MKKIVCAVAIMTSLVGSSVWAGKPVPPTTGGTPAPACSIADYEAYATMSAEYALVLAQTGKLSAEVAGLYADVQAMIVSGTVDTDLLLADADAIYDETVSLQEETDLAIAAVAPLLPKDQTLIKTQKDELIAFNDTLVLVDASLDLVDAIVVQDGEALVAILKEASDLIATAQVLQSEYQVVASDLAAVTCKK